MRNTEYGVGAWAIFLFTSFRQGVPCSIASIADHVLVVQAASQSRSSIYYNVLQVDRLFLLSGLRG
jgi:hypothetical protein